MSDVSKIKNDLSSSISKSQVLHKNLNNNYMNIELPKLTQVETVNLDALDTYKIPVDINEKNTSTEIPSYLDLYSLPEVDLNKSSDTKFDSLIIEDDSKNVSYPKQTSLEPLDFDSSNIYKDSTSNNENDTSAEISSLQGTYITPGVDLNKSSYTNSEYSLFVSSKQTEWKLSIKNEINPELKTIEKELAELEKFEDSFTKLNALYEDSKGWKEENIYTIVTNYQIAYCSDEKLKELGITREELQNMSVDALLNLCKEKDSDIKPLYEELDRLKEEELEKIVRENTEFNSYQEYLNTLEAKRTYKAYYEIKLEKTQELIDLAEYNCLSMLEDYQNFECKKISPSINFFVVDGHSAYLSYKKYVEKFGDISPLIFLEYARGESEELGVDLVPRNEISHVKQLSNLLRASAQEPELKNIYNYLYETEGEEKATEYLNKIEKQINLINAQIEAQKFLDTLKDEKDPEKALLERLEALATNHMKVTGKGLEDGLESFFENIASWLKSSRIYTENEYEMMYILLGLQNEEKYDELLDNNYELSMGIGTLLPSLTLSFLLSPTVGATAMGISTGGNAYHYSLVNGNEIKESMVYGVFKGLSDTILELAFGGIFNLGEGKVVDLGSYLRSIFEEGGEEFAQEYLDSLVGAFLFNESFNLSEVLENAKKSGIYGALTASILNSVPLALHQFEPIQRQNVEINARIENNTQNLKTEVLSNVSEDLPLIARARNIYIELNKRMSDIETDAINESTVVNESWAELYKDLLVTSGFDSKSIKVLGQETNDNHQWIQIQVDKDHIIIADALSNINGSNDLRNCELGAPTMGFMYADKSWSGTELANISDILKEYGKTWENIDKNIEGTNFYSPDRIASDLSLLEDFNAEEILFGNTGNEIPIHIHQDLQGSESSVLFNYYRNLQDSLYPYVNDSPIKVNFLVQNINGVYEGVTSLATKTQTGIKYIIYSESFGQKIFESLETYEDFLDKMQLTQIYTDTDWEELQAIQFNKEE